MPGNKYLDNVNYVFGCLHSGCSSLGVFPCLQISWKNSSHRGLL